MTSIVRRIDSMNDWNALLEISKSKTVVVDFSAEWCGPCRYMAPIFEQMADDFKDVVQFAKVDVDQCEAVAELCKIRAMPTFQIFKGGAKVDEVQGADQGRLRESILKHMK